MLAKSIAFTIILLYNISKNVLAPGPGCKAITSHTKCSENILYICVVFIRVNSIIVFIVCSIGHIKKAAWFNPGISILIVEEKGTKQKKEPRNIKQDPRNQVEPAQKQQQQQQKTVSRLHNGTMKHKVLNSQTNQELGISWRHNSKKNENG